MVALGFTFYVLQLLYLGFLLITAGSADTEPFQSAIFRHFALGISLAASVAVFALFYHRQCDRQLGRSACGGDFHKRVPDDRRGGV